MYLLYLDESGEPNFGDQTNFVLGAVAVFEGQIFKLSGQLDDIQSRYFPHYQMPLAFHATDIHGARGQFRALLRKEREALMSELYATIDVAGFPSLVAFAAAMHVSKAQSEDQVLHDTFQDLIQRFNTFLKRQHKLGHTHKGLVIIDQAHQKNYRQLLASFQKEGTEFGYIGNIIDIPYFAGSHDTRMIQLADLCAYAVFRNYEHTDPKYFNAMLERFDKRNPDGPIDGLKHFTDMPCGCLGCTRSTIRRQLHP